MKNKTCVGVLAILLALPALRLCAETAVMPICCVADFEKLTPVRMSGVSIDVTRLKPDEGGPALNVAFAKTGSERRFIALETQPREPLADFRALDLECRLNHDEEMNLRFAVLAFEAGGGAWCRTGRQIMPGPESRTMRFPVQGLRQAAFSEDASGELEWDAVDRFWVGFVADGKGKGTFELRKLVLTSEPYRPSEPVELLARDASAWSVGADPAVEKALEIVTLDGERCVKTTFRFPGGRHMYLVPAQPVDEIEYTAYAGLRLTYKATVPAGISGLLVSLYEHGGQFVAESSPKATGEWSTVTIPWSGFKLGSWSKDNDGRLNPDAITRVSIGVHGVAAADGGPGEVIVKSIQAVPPEK